MKLGWKDPTFVKKPRDWGKKNQIWGGIGQKVTKLNGKDANLSKKPQTWGEKSTTR